MTPLRIMLAVVTALAIAAAAWFFWPRELPPPPPGPVSREAPAFPPVPGPPQYPIAPPAASQVPLPALKESDPAMVEALAQAFGAALEKLFRLEDIVRNVVATIDNLPREAYSSRLNPARPIAGTFATTGKDGELAIAPENAARYAPWVAFAEGVDAGTLVGVYVRFYPLFQQAYVELGYPGGYFNDRLVEVIDHLLEAPEVQEPVLLAVPHVLFEFAEPELEQRSSGQKALMRMGNANAARLKAKLREIRAEILRATKPAPS